MSAVQKLSNGMSRIKQMAADKMRERERERKREREREREREINVAQIGFDTIYYLLLSPLVIFLPILPSPSPPLLYGIELVCASRQFLQAARKDHL